MNEFQIEGHYGKLDTLKSGRKIFIQSQKAKCQKMAVVLPLQISRFTKTPYLPLHKTTKPSFSILSQTSEPTNSTDKKPVPSSGQGFGPPQLPSPSPSGNKKGRIIRRSPVSKPSFLDKKSGVEDESVGPTLNEDAFLLTWLGLGGLILVEGLALAASGFLPEEWDKLFVKYLYPSFTPTVFLFIAGTVTYGVYKYFQNENANKKN